MSPFLLITKELSGCLHSKVAKIYGCIMDVNTMNIYLNVYLQIAIVYGILYLVKNLLWTFNYRRKTHNRYLDHINGTDTKYYVKQYFDCHNIIDDYLPIILCMPFAAVFWPLHVIKNM